MILPHAESTSPFQQFSFREREYLCRLAFTLDVDQWLPQGNRSDFDATFTHKDRLFIIESKVRNFPSTKFDSTMIEQPKYNKIKGYWKNKQCFDAWYVEFFNDDVALIYFLSQVEPTEWVRETHVKNTAENKGKIVKVIGYLPYSKGKMVKLINNV